MSQQILGITLHLQAHSEGLKADHLAKLVGFSRATANHWLTRMRSDGLATRYPFHGGPHCVWTLTSNLDATVAAYEAKRYHIRQTTTLEAKRLNQIAARARRRYEWPQSTYYVAPKRVPCSVWELAA